MIHIINQSAKPDDSELLTYESRKESFLCHYGFAHVITLTAIMCGVFNSINVNVQIVIVFVLI